MENGKPNLSSDERAGLTDLIAVSRDNRQELMERQRALVGRLDPTALKPPEEMAAESEQGLRALEEAVEAGDLSGYLANMRAQTADLADQGIPFEVIGQSLIELIDPIGTFIESTYQSDPKRSARASRALQFLETQFLLAAGAAYATVREDSVESEYLSVIRQMSTPVVEVWDEIVAMPLIGVLDSGRAQQMMEQLLERIAKTGARFVILDITGVPTIDTAVAEHLIKTTKASRLVGAEAVLVGISPRVAQTLVRLGVSLGDITTFPDLRSGLEHAFKSLGYQVEKRGN
jgi:rsbT co-antagonist protein RsbR